MRHCVYGGDPDPVPSALPDPPRLDPGALEPLLARDGIVVDTRDQERFAAGHVPGTINVQLDKGFPNWCGWFLPYDQPIYFVAEGGDQAREAARDLVLIGIDHAAGYFDQAALDLWRERHGALQTSRVVTWSEAEELAARGGLMVDVRKLTEWNEGHVPGARHIHLGYLRGRAAELPRDVPVVVYVAPKNAIAGSAGAIIITRPSARCWPVAASRAGSPTVHPTNSA